MGNKLEIELYDDLKAVREQAWSELGITYDYFKKINDPNGICILYNELVDFSLYCRIDLRNQLNSNNIQVPNRPWGFYECPFVQKAKEKADAAVINAIKQRKIESKQKLYMPNGSFYGYCCYNIYNKCLGWINYSLRSFGSAPSFCQSIMAYFERAMRYFMRYEG